MPKAICSIDGCEQPVNCRGWCLKHYTRWKRHGDPGAALVIHRQHNVRHSKDLSPVDRFWANIEKRGDKECWPWKGHINDVGYGLIKISGKPIRAHRFAYELLVGPIPEGLVLDHRCHDPKICTAGNACLHRRCCNPAHLLAVAQKENVSSERMWMPQAAQSHCKHGHEFTAENTLRASDGRRLCRACAKRRMDAFRTRQRSEP